MYDHRLALRRLSCLVAVLACSAGCSSDSANGVGKGDAGNPETGGASSSGGGASNGGRANGHGGSGVGAAGRSGNGAGGAAPGSGGGGNAGATSGSGGAATGGASAGSGGASAGSGGASASSGGASASSGGAGAGSGGASGGGGAGSGAVPVVGGCPIFTSDDEWNRDVSSDPTDATWTSKLYENATLKVLHPDFGPGFGIPFNVVPANQAKLPISFGYADESDPGPYPFPGSTAKIEGGTPESCGGDCHVLALQQGTCLLYEGYGCQYTDATASWSCGSGAKWDLTKNSYGQRPIGWTSADAAGLAILPGLVKYAEVAAGAVHHAIRFTMHCTQDGYVVPATHQAVPTGKNGCPAGIDSATLRTEYPPMGLRIRLMAGYDISGMPAQARIVAQAMKTYGMILADNGSDYFFQGDDDANWSNNQLNALKNIPGDQFEVIAPGTIAR
jgi:hypothetical protein